MIQRCKNCGEQVVKWPVKNQPEKSLITNFKERTINWKNMFKMDLVSIIFLIAVLLLAFGYSSDTKTCRDIIENTCYYCNKTNCCNYLEEQETRIPTNFNDSSFIIKSAGGELS